MLKPVIDAIKRADSSAKIEEKGKDVIVKTKTRNETKTAVEKEFKKQNILFRSVFKKSKSSSIDVLEITNAGDVIFKPIIQKGAGGLKFEDELKLDLINYFQGMDVGSLSHNDVIKKMEAVLGITPMKKLIPDKRGSKNQSRALHFNNSKVTVTNTSGNYITDITLMEPGKAGPRADLHHLSLKTSETFYILNAGIGKYFSNKATQVSICEFFGFVGQKMGGFGPEYACITDPVNYNKVRDNLEELLSEAYGYDMVLVHKKRQGDVLVKKVAQAPGVTITGLNDASYRYPEPDVRKYANISVSATIGGIRYKADFQFRGTTASDTGPRYLRILLKRL